ncbi:response regulator transcription factor [Alishewanella longhuensis]
MESGFLSIKRVLLVDDCAPVRASIKGMLQQIGFKLIFQAKDAIEAYALCQQHSFDFIL